MDMIRIENGVYRYEDFQLSMDFAVGRGSFAAVLGPSGAGKSTLLNVIAGLEALQQGRVLLDDAEQTRVPPADRPVNFVFQDNNTFAHLSARDNVGLGLSPSLRLTDVQWNAVDAALQKVGIAHLSMRKPGEMSGGERQRIALARVLVRDKPILLLDEAFAALGPSLRRELLQTVKAIQMEKQLTVLMVTHQPDDARLVADRVMFVDGGKVHAPVATKRFFASRDAAIVSYLGETG
jgi:thiamine transport system ATP-binding protein